MTKSDLLHERLKQATRAIRHALGATNRAAVVCLLLSGGYGGVRVSGDSTVATPAPDVQQLPPALLSLTLSPMRATLPVGGQLRFHLIVKKSNDDVQTTISYSSSSTGLVTVDSSGLVTGVAPGAAEVTVVVRAPASNGLAATALTLKPTITVVRRDEARR